MFTPQPPLTHNPSFLSYFPEELDASRQAGQQAVEAYEQRLTDAQHAFAKQLVQTRDQHQQLLQERQQQAEVSRGGRQGRWWADICGGLLHANGAMSMCLVA